MTDGAISREYLLAIPLPPMSRLSASHGGPEEGVPPAFAESHALYLEAHAAYRARAYERAADGFVRAALALRVPAGIHAETAAHNRAALFEDAAYAWLSANTPEVGRATLERLRAKKLATVQDLRKALEVLARP